MHGKGFVIIHGPFYVSTTTRKGFGILAKTLYSPMRGVRMRQEDSPILVKAHGASLVLGRIRRFWRILVLLVSPRGRGNKAVGNNTGGFSSDIPPHSKPSSSRIRVAAV
jgi:hypothetical protein